MAESIICNSTCSNDESINALNAEEEKKIPKNDYEEDIDVVYVDDDNADVVEIEEVVIDGECVVVEKRVT
ncbi:unnamed protein product [Strongylus vulgaris]|uniref:Uncharacterized protein n=1 Tax=Strongylus vulgaris TaxID=40348 RepID=A0A3P7L0G0_STRVU|nr:unnamed protein product [Strongylus vulgaris]